jgi:hypothetical protein
MRTHASRTTFLLCPHATHFVIHAQETLWSALPCPIDIDQAQRLHIVWPYQVSNLFMIGDPVGWDSIGNRCEAKCHRGRTIFQNSDARFIMFLGRRVSLVDPLTKFLPLRFRSFLESTSTSTTLRCALSKLVVLLPTLFSQLSCRHFDWWQVLVLSWELLLVPYACRPYKKCQKCYYYEYLHCSWKLSYSTSTKDFASIGSRTLIARDHRQTSV